MASGCFPLWCKVSLDKVYVPLHMCWVHDGETRGIGIRFTGARQQESPDGSWKFYIHTVVSHTHTSGNAGRIKKRDTGNRLWKLGSQWRDPRNCLLVHWGETTRIARLFMEGLHQYTCPLHTFKVLHLFSSDVTHTHNHTHTHPAGAGSTLARQEEKKKRTQTTGKWTEQRRGRGEQTDLRNQPTRRTDLNRTEHAQKPHNTLKRGRTNGGQKFCLVFGPKMQGRTLFPQRDRSRSIQKGHKQLSVLHGLCARRRNHTWKHETWDLPWHGMKSCVRSLLRMHSHSHAACMYQLDSFLFNLQGPTHSPASTQTSFTQTTFCTNQLLKQLWHNQLLHQPTFTSTRFTQPVLWDCRPKAKGPAECRRLLNTCICELLGSLKFVGAPIVFQYQRNQEKQVP